MTDFTKCRFIDLPRVRDLKIGDVFTDSQAARIGWVPLQKVGLQFICPNRWDVTKNDRRWTVGEV